jgi:Zn-dependent metalloprotease
LSYTRYQQYVQPQGAAVDGAQLTVVKRGSTTVLVIGGYYPSARATNRLVVGGPEAVALAAADKKLLRNAVAANAKLKHRVELWLNPENGRLFQQVESGTLGQSFVHQVDAETGEIIDSWDATQHIGPGEGTGVKGDTKDLSGLTTPGSPNFQLKSPDDRVQTHNGTSTSNLNGAPVMVDSDDAWLGDLQRPAVDAQFYTALTDKWYRDQVLFDLIGDCADTADASDWVDLDLHSIVHYNYGQYRFNAFFDGSVGRFGYGDGDGISYRPFSAGQDVVSHELTHRATQCRAPLAYTSWSGALNEAISDIMATAIEWDTNEATSSGCKRGLDQNVCPDWWLGEDVVLDASWAFRNLADPTMFGDPAHWDERFCPSGSSLCGDNGGVHYNSLIPGHAFYLMVNGGRNARCSGPTDPQADCDVVVPSIPIDEAAQIMFAGWGLLPNPSPSNTSAFNKQFCNTHAASVYEAALLFPGSASHIASADLAWTSVGRGYGPDTTAPGADCQPPNAFLTPGPQPPTFAPQIAQHSITLAPNSSGSLDVTPGNVAHALTVDDDGLAVASYDAASTEIDISVPPDMPNGVYPLVLSETSATDTAYAGATLIVDTNAPAALVRGVSLATPGQVVGTNGAVPLLVTWSAEDAESGIDSSALEKSTNGTSGWTSVATGGTGTTSTVSTVDVTDYFRVTASDAAGNSGTSDVSGPWTIGRMQEDSATYKGVWSAMPSPTTFGTTRFTTKLGAWARFNFSGTEVAVVSTRAVGRGKVKIFVDGVFQRKVNLATGTLGQRQIVYRLGGLTAGSHSIRIQNITGGKRIDVDGIVFLNH